MFIVIEGIDYSGKTTVLNRMVKILEDLGHKVKVTREPGGGVIGEKVRGILVSHPMDKDVWGLLLAATRLEHCREVINPALERNEIVVCSRYMTSTYIYQPESIPLLKAHLRQYPEITEPDIMILCDCPIEVIMERKLLREKENPGDNDFMDEDYVPYFNEQREKFLQLAHKLGDKAFVLDTTKPEHEQYRDLLGLFSELNIITMTL